MTTHDCLLEVYKDGLKGQLMAPVIDRIVRKLHRFMAKAKLVSAVSFVPLYS